ncbi:hypothetical protein HMPREF0490_00735 [Lachnospiraceae bacterium 6_1_37FAA]|nr:hypothetical protein HMPREF0490_00735 [Lachnospiraceae bacterium 6_1_37FAA]
MMLNVRTYKVKRSDGNPVYKTYRYSCFDSASSMDGKTFEEKFNAAMNILKEEVDEDRRNNEVDKYEPIVIADVFLS